MIKESWEIRELEDIPRDILLSLFSRTFAKWSEVNTNHKPSLTFNGVLIITFNKWRNRIQLSVTKSSRNHGQLLKANEKRLVLRNSLHFECSHCKHRVSIETSLTTVGVSDTNRRAAYPMSEIGLGRESLSPIWEIMNLPQPVSNSNFQEHNKDIHNAAVEAVDSQLREAGLELREKMLEENPNLSEDSLLYITVSYDSESILSSFTPCDSTWSKRGFTANYGVGFVTAAESGKILDVITLSKTCEICKQGNKLKSDSTKYQQFKSNHKNSGKCQKISSSSPFMEKKAARILWKISVEKHGFRYTFIACDVDSKAHSKSGKFIVCVIRVPFTNQ